MATDNNQPNSKVIPCTVCGVDIVITKWYSSSLRSHAMNDKLKRATCYQCSIVN